METAVRELMRWFPTNFSLITGNVCANNLGYTVPRSHAEKAVSPCKEDTLGLFIRGIAEVLAIVLNLYMWVVIISALLTWVNPDPYNPIVRTLRNLTEPVFWRIRRWMPFLNVGGLDLSPIVVLLTIIFLKTFLVGNLYNLSMYMG